jgi:predicted ATP-binding protein involved in virulence
MKLSKIEITNFRCYESLALELRPDINIVVGINGAGKTTILDAIAVALYDIVEANGAGNRSRQKAGLAPTDIHISPEVSEDLAGLKDFVQVRAAVQGFYPLSGFPAGTAEDKPMSLEWNNYIQYQPPRGFRYGRGDDKGPVKIAEYYKALWQEIRKADPKALIPLPVVAYYRADRFVRQMPDLGGVLKMKLAREDAFQSALNAAVGYQTFFQWLYLRENNEVRDRLQHRDEPDFEYPDLRAVRSAVAKVIDNVTRIYFDGTPPSLKIALADPSNGDFALELEQLSEGYRSLLVMVLDFARRLAQAHPNWPNPLEAPGILLVDEIELHLHPKWQQSVIPNLRSAFPNTQIIAATHSPEVLTTVRRENIHLLGSDHSIEQIPCDVGTFGAESSRVLQEVFGAHARPQQIETVQQLDEYLGLVEAQQQDADRGRELRVALESALGRSDPDLQRADARISQLKVLMNR